jgi:hypothetical protein
MTTTNNDTTSPLTLDEVLTSNWTLSHQMRYLHFTLGMTYYGISKVLNKRPQHVRNVCITPVKNPKT